MHVTILAAAGIVEMARDTAETFGWNLQLFLSQVVSFVLVALLLRRFAYTPILNVLHERRERIEESLRNAEKIKLFFFFKQKTAYEILAKANAEAQKMIEEA